MFELGHAMETLFNDRFRGSNAARFVLLIVVCVLCTGTSEKAQDRQSPHPFTIEALIRSSKFIFFGRVESVYDSNLKVLQPSNLTAVVRVREVLYAEGATTDFTGRQITVLLLRAHEFQTGQEAIFFTNAILYGNTIAVREKGTFPSGEEAAIRKAIPIVRQQQSDEALTARLKQAALVVVGHVTATQRLELREGKTSRTEHEADWWVAEIQIESVLKGEARTSRIRVIYPNSGDVMWFKVPKFHPGEEGIWILRPTSNLPQQLKTGEPIYTAIDPLDFQPKFQSDRVRRLAAGQ